MKKIILFFGILLSMCVINQVSYSNSKHIRMAIFDNPQPDPSRTDDSRQYVNSYLAGINTAITVAANRGIIINEKEFFYPNNLSSIIQQASNTKAWKPDVIIGLSTSNDFLMSKAFFGDQIILSISATDPSLVNLPKGFYSLGIPDTDAVNAIIKFISRHYPNSNLFITAAAESKESVDFADLLSKKFKSQYKNKKVIERKFLIDDLEHLSFAKFMSGYQKDDVIVIMSIGYDSAIDLMNKISKFLNPVKPIFVTSADNWGNNIIAQPMNGQYDAYRIDTLTGNENSKDYKIFLEQYKKIYHGSPTQKISFATYQTVMSFVDALTRFPSNKKLFSKTDLLNSYNQALRCNPNWYRPSHYIVYKIANQKENYYEII